jgi:hypothetical protein
VIRVNEAHQKAITAVQQDILRASHGDIKDIPQLWAIYKEVMGYYATGVSSPMARIVGETGD